MNEHTIEVRVRYQETDQMGVVYYANYLVWFEMARTELFRARGMEYSRLEKEDKIYLPVVESHCRYRVPLGYDDQVSITAKLTDIGASRLTFEYEVKGRGRLAATGMTKHAFIDESGKPVHVPGKVKKALGSI